MFSDILSTKGIFRPEAITFSLDITKWDERGTIFANEISGPCKHVCTFIIKIQRHTQSNRFNGFSDYQRNIYC